MSRDMITVGSTMRIPLLYRGKYSQWRERFMNYLEEQTDGEAMIDSIQNGDLLLPVIAPVSLAGTAQNASPTLKDPKFWTAEEKKTQKIDRLARSLLIQGLLNDIYSLIDSNKTAKDLWDALERQMHGSEYAEQDRKAAILYEYETFKATEGEQFLDTYLCYLQGDVNDALGYKKKAVMVTSDPLALVAEKKKEINANMVFMAQIKKVLSESDESSSSAEETIAEEQNNEFNEKIKVLNEKNADLLAQTEVLQDQLKVRHVVIDTHAECQAQYEKHEEERYEYMIGYSALCDNDKQHKKKIDEQEILFDKMSRQLVEMNNNVLRLQEKILVKETKISELEGCVSNKDVEIEKCLERLNECENKLHKIGQTNQTIHMIMPSKDILYNGRKGIGFENLSYFEKAKDLRPSLYDEKQTSSLKPYVPNVILEKIIIDLEDEVVSILEKKANLNTIEYLKSKECDKMENSKVIALGLFKLSVSQNISPISMTKTSCDSKSVEMLEDLSIAMLFGRRKGSSNTSHVDLSSVSHLKLNKDVKRYSRKDLLSCNNSHLGETSSAYVCNDAMNVSCNSRLCDLFDENNLFIFDDESVRISPVSKMPFRKKPHDSLNVCSKRNSNQSLARNVHRWLSKMQPLAEPVAKWIPIVEGFVGGRQYEGDFRMLQRTI
nr:hypothetical protein [Tanacetum cinerariifolium]